MVVHVVSGFTKNNRARKTNKNVINSHWLEKGIKNPVFYWNCLLQLNTAEVITSTVVKNAKSAVIGRSIL